MTSERFAYDLLSEADLSLLGTFQKVGHHVVRASRLPPGGRPPGSLQEVIDGRIVNVSRHNTGIYVTPAGRPHHIRGGTGYWHVNDVDEIVLSVAGLENGYGLSVLFFDVKAAHRWDKFAWYCLTCHRPLFDAEANTGEGGWDEFLRVEGTAVANFNGDPSHRTCPDCGAIHPLGYRIYRDGETAGEAEARTQW
jgi:hypothetical protein